MRRKVLIIPGLHESGLDILQRRKDFEVVIPDGTDAAALHNHLPDVQAIALRLPPVRRDIIDNAPNLKIISRHGVGVDNVDVDACTARGIPVTVVGEANAPSVMEHTLAFILALAKRLPYFDRAVRGGDYNIKFKLDAIDIAGRTILIVGLGRIGSRVARACNGLGMKCLGVDPAHSDEKIRALGCEPVRDFRAALPRADFVTLHCPLQPDTRDMIGADELALMKPSAYVVNCARGGIVNEWALVDALNAGRLMGAAVDAQVREPPPADDPLMSCDRLLLTPHSAATTQEGMIRMAVATAQNICDFFDGKLDPANVFNAEALKRARS